MPLGNSNYPAALDVHANDASITPYEFGEQIRILTLLLTADVDNVVTTFDTSSTAALPSKGVGVIGDETFTWSAKTANSLTVARGQFGSTASAHVTGDVIGIVPTAAVINAHAKAITEIEKKLGYKTGGANQVPAADTILGGDAAGQTSYRKATVTDISPSTALAIPRTNAAGNAVEWGSAGQIVFPATQNASGNANTLDDYEEGSWTPTLGGTTTYTVQSGTYTKIGNRVHYSMYLAVNVIGTGSPSTISGLPFSADDYGGGSIPFDFGLAIAVVSVVAYIQSGLSTIQLGARTAAAVSMTVPANVLGNSAQVVSAGQYRRT